MGFIITRLLDNDLFIVDQHATDEKYRYEDFLNNTKIVSQRLVCPQSLDLDPGKKEILKENISILEELGFGFDVGENCKAKAGLPLIFPKAKLTKVPRCDRIVLGKKYFPIIMKSDCGRLSKYCYALVSSHPNSGR